MRKILIIQYIIIALFGLVSCQNKNAELEKKIQSLEKENAEILKKQQEQEKQLKEQKEKEEKKKQLTPKIKDYESKLRDRVASYEQTRDKKTEEYGWGVEASEASEKLNEKLDDELTKVYNLIMERLSDAEKTEFRNSQRQWLKTRKRKVENSVKSEGGEMMMGGLGAANVEMAEYEEITKERLYEFAQIYDEME